MVNRGFEHRSGQANDCTIVIYCFTAKHATLKSKSRIGCLGIRIICPSAANCYLNELALINPTKYVGLVDMQWASSSPSQ